MTDKGIAADAAQRRLAALCEIEWLEELRTAHGGLFERDDALAAVDAALAATLCAQRENLAALVAA